MSALPLSPQDRYNSLRSLFETTDQTAHPDLLKKYHTRVTELYTEVAKMECFPYRNYFMNPFDLQLFYNKVYSLATEINYAIQRLYSDNLGSSRT